MNLSLKRIWNFGGLLNAYWETIKVDTKTDNFIDLFSLSSDNEELHLKKRISLKKKKKRRMRIFEHRISVFWRENSPYLNRSYLQNK